MKKLASHFALLALTGALSVAVPAFAAPPPGPGGAGGPGAGPNCSDPAMAKSPACMTKGKPGMHHMGPGSPGGNAPMMGHKPPPPPTGKMPPPPPPGHKGPPGPPPGPAMGPTHMGPGHMAPGMGPGMGPGHKGPPQGFQSFRHSFHFPHFAPPSFSVGPGLLVPRSYHERLRPLPPQFFGYYPMYRGYLFFITPDGQIVVVSPRSFRIIAII